MSAAPTVRLAALRSEIPKLWAFMRRDFKIAWSYKLPFFTDWVGMLVQVFMFQFVGMIVDPSLVPSYEGNQATYMEFVAVGIAISTFTGIALGRVYAVVRQEQVQGTLESLMLTPTASTTIELGSVVYDLVYVPVRMTIFFLLTTVLVGTDFYWSGLLVTIPLLLAYIPFVWGLGIMAAAWTITYKRGTGVIGLVTTALTLTSGAYFPIDVLPAWLQKLAALNPMAIALDGARDALLGGATFAQIATDVLALLPFAVVSMVLGTRSFQAALSRERRRGTLGLY